MDVVETRVVAHEEYDGVLKSLLEYTGRRWSVSKVDADLEF